MSNSVGSKSTRQSGDPIANVYAAIIRNARGFRPEWDGLKPGQHPRLPKRPPTRMVQP